MGSHQRHVAFLSPPVHIALWAHMHHFDQLWQNMLAPPDNLFIIEYNDFLANAHVGH